ncbi:MAG: hypothetical protein GC136_08410 [Alphaproteobacteria bacterium]|nr:hypothetical protein [Alphaproteobacteria bacterium]
MKNPITMSAGKLAACAVWGLVAATSVAVTGEALLPGDQGVFSGPFSTEMPEDFDPGTSKMLALVAALAAMSAGSTVAKYAREDNAPRVPRR